jgi:hypothetical protein
MSPSTERSASVAEYSASTEHSASLTEYNVSAKHSFPAEPRQP